MGIRSADLRRDLLPSNDKSKVGDGDSIHVGGCGSSVRVSPNKGAGIATRFENVAYVPDLPFSSRYAHTTGKGFTATHAESRIISHWVGVSDF